MSVVVKAPASSTSLFDRYAGVPESHRAVSRRPFSSHATRTSQLRSMGVKLACYLNTECDRGRATVIHLPEEVDTLGEVLPMIQSRLRLDGRMLYASELFLPNGDKVNTYQQLVDASQKVRVPLLQPVRRLFTVALKPVRQLAPRS